MNTKRITKIALMIALTIAGAYITIPLPELPFTLQTLFALLSGLLLSRRDALISQLIYITLGLIGLPVFAAGGGGLAYVLRPSFGYILCLPTLAYFSSLLKDKNIYLAVYMPLILLLFIGGTWLILVGKLYLAKGIGMLFVSIILIYIPIEIVKGTIGIFIWKRLKNIL